MERAERSGGLHKRSAEAWGHPCAREGAEPTLAVVAFAVAAAFQNIRVGVAGRNRPAEDRRGGGRRPRAGRSREETPPAIVVMPMF